MRGLVWTTVGFLLLNSALLIAAAVVTRRFTLLAAAGLMLLLAFGVLVLRRRFSAQWDELSAARQDLRLEASALAEAARRAEQSGDQ
ncbi:MAG TPA: hypothetical protein VFO95_13095 [Gemmatimonadales bacterium]|nr:hypothetical protein [Gemmatimonadales bacterium]